MAVGNVAKEKLMDKIINAVGSSYIGFHDKKYYFWSEENGQKVQIAVSMTCPKTPIEVDKTVDTGGDWDFTDTPKSTALPIASAGPAEITDEEVDNIKTLFEKLGL